MYKRQPCNYLPEQEERLLVAVDPRLDNELSYEQLMAQGFRRSGDQVYRPYCVNCQACNSLRVISSLYKASKSQKRLIKNNKHLKTVISTEQQDNYYALYEEYINTVHCDGSMFPASIEQYENFITSKNTQQIYIELWDEDVLINVAVTDVLSHALSAVYTFYKPSYRDKGIGMFSIIKQIEVSLEMNKDFLYLGYQIDECKKMNYKNRFFPHQRLIKNSWLTVNK